MLLAAKLAEDRPGFFPERSTSSSSLRAKLGMLLRLAHHFAEGEGCSLHPDVGLFGHLNTLFQPLYI
jgi:hypothetical protein